jgi:hypothetical protein
MIGTIIEWGILGGSLGGAAYYWVRALRNPQSRSQDLGSGTLLLGIAMGALPQTLYPGLPEDAEITIQSCALALIAGGGATTLIARWLAARKSKEAQRSGDPAGV